MTPALSIQHVSFGYGRDRLVLEDVSLTLDPGDIVALRGRSGCGKSTLLHCAAGLLPVARGVIDVDGQDLAGLDEHGRAQIRRQRLGVVLQFGQLLDELTALENVALPLALLRVGRSEARARARSLLAELELDHLRDRRPALLSGGEAQRVAVARALATEPAVVLADEPTGALDSKAAELVLGLLAAACRRYRAALLLVTHDVDVAQRADREVVMRDGRLLDSTS